MDEPIGKPAITMIEHLYRNNLPDFDHLESFIGEAQDELQLGLEYTVVSPMWNENMVADDFLHLGYVYELMDHLWVGDMYGFDFDSFILEAQRGL